MESQDLERENQELKEHLDQLEGQVDFHRSLKLALERSKNNLLRHQSYEDIR